MASKIIDLSTGYCWPCFEQAPGFNIFIFDSSTTDRRLQADVLALQATVMVTKMIGLEFSRYLQSSANNFESIFASKVVGF